MIGYDIVNYLKMYIASGTVSLLYKWTH